MTSHDVAAAVGVSQATVSRALRGDSRVAEQTRKRVAETAQKLDYTPNVAARSLSTSRAATIGIVVSDITNPFYPALVDVLQLEFGLAGYRTVLFHDRAGIETLDLTVQLLGQSVDGVVSGSTMLDANWFDAVLNAGVPVIQLNRCSEDVTTDRVVSENVYGGELAARCLFDLGHRRIASISGPLDTSTGRDRDLGFTRALEALGAPGLEELKRTGSYSHQSGYQWCLDLLSREEPPTAIFCGNDVIAFGALDAARSLHIPVPEQLSVVGFDDIDMASWETFGLTTIRQPLDRMARAAARMLVERIGGDDPEPRLVSFPARLVRRSSTGPLQGREVSPDMEENVI